MTVHVSRIPGATVGWAIRWRSNLYVVAVDDEDLPAQRYWGAALPERDWPVLAQGLAPRWRTSSSRPTEAEEEVLPRGGLRWGVAGIQLRWPSGDEELAPVLVADEVVDDEHGTTLRLSLVDPAHADLRIDLCYHAAEPSDVLERWVELHLEPGSPAPVVVDRLDSANWLVPESAGYRMSYVSGHWGSENLLHREPVPHGEFTLVSRTGTTSHHTNPWVMVDDGSASEGYGTVRTVGLAWSGTWRMDVQRRPEGVVSVTAGAGHESARRVLRPGESLTTPASYGVVTSGGFGAASRAVHRYADLITPQPTRTRPVLYNSWEATEFDVNSDGQQELARRAAGDRASSCSSSTTAGSGPDERPRGLGDWTPNPDRFPDGLNPLADDGARARDAVRPLGRARDGQPGQRAVPRAPRLGAALPRPGADASCATSSCSTSPAPTSREWATRLARTARRRARPRLPQVGHEPPLHRSGLAGQRRDQRHAVGRARARASTACCDRLRAAHPGPAARVLQRRRRPGRPRRHGAHGPGVDLRQHRRRSTGSRIQHGFSQIYPAKAMMPPG